MLYYGTITPMQLKGWLNSIEGDVSIIKSPRRCRGALLAWLRLALTLTKRDKTPVFP